MKTFKAFLAEAKAAADVPSVMKKHGLARSDTGNMGHHVYRPSKITSVTAVSDDFQKLGYKRVTHYARGGPDSRMPESGPHVYKKEAGYGGSETLTVNHDGTGVKHIIHSSQRSRD